MTHTAFHSSRVNTYIQPILVVALFAVFSACERQESRTSNSTTLISALTADTSGYARVHTPRDFDFPADFGPHPEYQLEWWYYTGNLLDAHGRRFGYQLTFFRNALSAQLPSVSASHWRSNQLYFAHFALSDIANEQFYPFERFSRGAAGLAGAQAVPYRVWLDDWYVEQRGDSTVLHALQDSIAIRLNLFPLKPIVLQGNRGMSRKSVRPGNASYYYSITRLQTSGSVHIGERRFDVSGTSWLDREWSTSVLDEGQVGWDWFSLQLDDGREVMLYQLRRDDGSTDVMSSGILVGSDGSSSVFNAADFRISTREYWISPSTGRRYPSGWHISAPSHGLDLQVTPAQRAQELPFFVTYWEGAVDIQGQSVAGVGYVELTGY